MLQTEIPRQEWGSTLRRFSEIHEGWLASVEVCSPEMGSLPEIMNLPLLGVSFETNHHTTVFISAGPSYEYHVTHAVQQPTRIWLERADDGRDVGLEVEAQGVTTVVRVTPIPR